MPASIRPRRTPCSPGEHQAPRHGGACTLCGDQLAPTLMPEPHTHTRHDAIQNTSGRASDDFDGCVE